LAQDFCFQALHFSLADGCLTSSVQTDGGGGCDLATSHVMAAATALLARGCLLSLFLLP